MEKNATQIAEEITNIVMLEKLAEICLSDELIKEAFRFPPGLAGKVKHVISRLHRVDQKVFQQRLEALAKRFRAKARNNTLKDLPRDWYHPIKNKEGKLLGYAAGHGSEVSTALRPEHHHYGTLI